LQCDRPDSKIEREQLDAFCQDHGFIGWFATSAAENIQVDAAMNFLVGNILKVSKDNNRPAMPASDALVFTPTAHGQGGRDGGDKKKDDEDENPDFGPFQKCCS